MEIKIDNDVNLFDVNKICRTCLTDKTDMRPVFMQDDSTGPTSLAEMLMGFTSVQV